MKYSKIKSAVKTKYIRNSILGNCMYWQEFWENILLRILGTYTDRNSGKLYWHTKQKIEHIFQEFWEIILAH